MDVLLLVFHFQTVQLKYDSAQTLDLSGLQQDNTNWHYRAVEGEIFMVPCVKSVNKNVEAERFGTGECRAGNKGSSLNCGEKFIAEAKHSGNYTCDTG